MNSVKNLNKWANTHTYLTVDLVRITLGVFLFMKGISFITNIQYLNDLISPIDRIGGGMFLIHYIAPAHMVGGIMIAFGLLTRWAIITQLPILVGATIINFMGAMHSQNLLLALLILGACIFFLFYGSGKNSADYYFKMQQ
ncbi:DoxX family protein [Flavobacterium sp. GSP27]|uniref:DoxX family protein n=1 Tax=Flavobacterium bomense TaxID=2497483 RepID=A0A3S0Q8I1_9FLAO|nr:MULTISPECIES: DoxX family protein [Flavobacterium]RTY96758.1 DoxX family protein [Flavobacterium sp. GSN2]RTY64814.1 DoxX family protein [Flavobacterium sp. LB2P53]RTY72700.1 DoxX family protein [Flavobacterium sp. LS1R10]RTY81046.1 DoxX family protein [Flavobacterium sp. ZB4P23]RTY81143.1 DoxX family protein [Flavobacterium sp. LS1P28]